MIGWLKAIPAVGSIIKSVFGDKEARDQQGHVEQMSVYNQFASEFGHAKTWWDSLIDGLNRLIRPAFSFGIVWMFYYCVSNPAGFTEAMVALKNMPYEGWVAMWMIMGFWFGTKAIEKMPKGFGKLNTAAPAVENVKPKEKPETVKTASGDPEWNERVKKRYSDYNNLNE